MTQDQNPNGKSISREEMLERHRQRNWSDHTGEWSEFSRRALQGLQYHPENEPLEARLQRIEGRIGQRSAKRRHLPLRRIMSIAATAAVLLIAAYFAFLRPAAQPDLFASNFEFIPSVTHGEERARNSSAEVLAGATPTSLRAAMTEAYEAERYEEAEHFARAYLEEAPEDREARFFYGILLLGKGNARAAMPHLAAIKQDSEAGAFARPAAWYLGLAYLKAGQAETARRLFAELTDGKDRYASQAKAILRRL